MDTLALRCKRLYALMHLCTMSLCTLAGAAPGSKLHMLEPHMLHALQRPHKTGCKVTHVHQGAGRAAERQASSRARAACVRGFRSAWTSAGAHCVSPRAAGAWMPTGCAASQTALACRCRRRVWPRPPAPAARPRCPHRTPRPARPLPAPARVFICVRASMRAYESARAAHERARACVARACVCACAAHEHMHAYMHDKCARTAACAAAVPHLAGQHLA